MNEIVHFRPIGKVVSPVGKPADEKWSEVISEIHLKRELARGLTGLETFSHIFVVYYMQESIWNDSNLILRPLGRTDMPMVGIFAQKARQRPNAIGATAVPVISVEDNIIRVKGLDVINGTAILDIKPYYPAFDRVDKPVVPEWVDRLMKLYFPANVPAEKRELLLVNAPALIQAAGEVPKVIEEYFGRVSSKTDEISIARMKSPGGWSEPGQMPEFDEYTVVLKGMLRVATREKTFDLREGQGVLARGKEWVRYSTPDPEGAEYISICLPAFSTELAHRGAGEGTESSKAKSQNE